MPSPARHRVLRALCCSDRVYRTPPGFLVSLLPCLSLILRNSRTNASAIVSEDGTSRAPLELPHWLAQPCGYQCSWRGFGAAARTQSRSGRMAEGSSSKAASKPGTSGCSPRRPPGRLRASPPSRIVSGSNEIMIGAEVRTGSLRTLRRRTGGRKSAWLLRGGWQETPKNGRLTGAGYPNKDVKPGSLGALKRVREIEK